MSVTNEELLNGAASLLRPNIDPSLIGFIEDLLRKARTGQITSIAAITVSGLNKIEWPAHGGQVGELYMGADLLQQHIRDMLTGQRKVMRPGG